MFRKGMVRNPKRAGSCNVLRLAAGTDESKRGLIDTPRRLSRKAPGAWEEVGRNPAKALVCKSWKGETQGSIQRSAC